MIARSKRARIICPIVATGLGLSVSPTQALTRCMILALMAADSNVILLMAILLVFGRAPVLEKSPVLDKLGGRAPRQARDDASAAIVTKRLTFRIH